VFTSRATAVTTAKGGNVGFGMVLPFQDQLRKFCDVVYQATILTEGLNIYLREFQNLLSSVVGTRQLPFRRIDKALGPNT